MLKVMKIVVSEKSKLYADVSVGERVRYGEKINMCGVGKRACVA